MFAKALVALFLALPFVAQSALASKCSRTYVVKSGDICDSISAANNVSTYQLAAVNQGDIAPTCNNLYVNQKLCLAHEGEDCGNVYVVNLGDTCESLETKFGINSTFLWQNNPQINSGCTNIYVGEVLCIGGGSSPPPAGVSVDPPPMAIPANPSATGVHSTTSSTTPTPTPTPSSHDNSDDDNLPWCEDL